MSDWYILQDKKPVKVGYVDYVIWFDKNQDTRILKQTKYKNLFVSTVFLGLDHRSYRSYLNYPDPTVFETIVFENGDERLMVRYRDYDEAIIGHFRSLLYATIEDKLDFSVFIKEDLREILGPIPNKLISPIHKIKNKFDEIKNFDYNFLG